MEKEHVPVSAFGALLRSYRLAAGLSQEVLAEQARMSVDGISLLERGVRRSPHRETVALLVKALGLSPAVAAEFESAAARPRQPLGRTSPKSSIADGGASTTNLPFPRTNLIGREGDIEEIVGILLESRLVTVTGTGGVGKSRTALAIGDALRRSAQTEVWLVELAPLKQGSFVASTIAQVLNVEESLNCSLLEILIANIKNKALLLILDNCEHVIAETAPLAAALLRDCQYLSILTTSREPLRIDGERTYRLPSLGVPQPADGSAASRERFVDLTVDEALGYGSIALFVDRARAAESRFELTPQNTASVAEICRRLDGIPLAIELAAARVRVLAPRQIEQKLDERFRILTGGARTALPRQQTMRALIDWSYDLLDGREQSLLSGLSIFSGSFSLESATAVCAGDELEEFDVLDGLTSLVEKSLVVGEWSEDDMRYRLLESMREYGRERLDERGKRAEIAHRHAVAYTELAERLEQEYGSTPYRTWVARAECEIENIRAALGWAFGPGGDIQVGLRLAAMLRRIFNTSHTAEARRWVQTALGRVSADSPPRVVAQLELTDAHLASRLNQFNAALSAARRALAKFEAVGDQRGMANAKRWAGRSLILLGEIGEGETLLHSALDAYAKLGVRKVGGLYLDLGSARSARGDIAGARDFFARALKQFEEDQDEANIAITAGTLAEAEFHCGDPQAAVRRAHDALAAASHLAPATSVWIQSNMAAFLIALGRFDEARQCAQGALQNALHLQLEFLIIVLLQHLAATLALERTPSRDRLTGKDWNRRHSSPGTSIRAYAKSV